MKGKQKHNVRSGIKGSMRMRRWDCTTTTSGITHLRKELKGAKTKDEFEAGLDKIPKRE